MKNFQRLFGEMWFNRGIDEFILYYSIYPEWSDTRLKWVSWNAQRRSDAKKVTCSMYFYSEHKPFVKSANDVPDYFNYDRWDELAVEFLKKYPRLHKYFSHIKEFRKVDY